MIGRTISHYEILELLGEGGMGAVYKARDTRLNRYVAIKSLRGTTAAQKARFVQEAQAASALNHPNIVTVYDLLADGGDDYIVMEFIPGLTLDRGIARAGLPLERVLQLAIPAASALTAAHEAGITHRDVKPGNIIVREDGGVKVLDFGLAKFTESGALEAGDATRTQRAQTEEGSILGTISYMSPEQAEGRKVDARSDIFSFGAVLYEMVTGRRAFQGQSKLSTLSAILKEEPKPPGELGIAVPRELERIISRCLRKDAGRRYQSMQEARLALEDLKEDSNSGRLDPALGAAVGRPGSRWPVPAGLALLVALSGGAYFWPLPGPVAPVGLPDIKLRQLTNDAGLTTTPALSPDNKLAAFASDRAGNAGMDIWVQQLAEGSQPIRLTERPGNEVNPAFSPDGGQIAFVSREEGGGLYVMPALGGTQRLLARGDFNGPSFSPDGQWIATRTFGGEFWLYVIPVSGGPPRRVAENHIQVNSPVWSPDGKRILFGGRERLGSPDDWWTVSREGGVPASAGARGVVPVVDGSIAVPAAWLGDYVYFRARNITRVRISPEGKLAATPERLTSGSGNESFLSAIALPGGGGTRVAYAAQQGFQDLRRLGLDANTGRRRGEAEPLFRDRLDRTSPSISADGSKLAYVAASLGNHDLRVRNLATGSEQTLVQLRSHFRARISPDGSTVAYNPSSTNEAETTIFVVSAQGGDSRKLCDNCGLIYDWAPDSKRLNFRTGKPIRFFEIEIGSGAKRDLIGDPALSLHGAKYSPDGRWAAVHYAPGGAAPPGIFLAALRDGKAAPSNEWIRIMGRRGTHTRPWWSPDGNTLYFLSNAGADMEIWRQKLKPGAKTPDGEPAVVFQADRETGNRLLNLPAFGPGEARDFLIFPISRSTANIWIADIPER